MVGSFESPKDGFWELSSFNDTVNKNPWVNGTSMAPFDQKVMNSQKVL